MTGNFLGSIDLGLGAVAPGAVLAKFDTAGNALVSRAFRNTNTKSGKLAVLPDNGPVATVNFKLDNDDAGHRGRGVIAFDAEGTERWRSALQDGSDATLSDPSLIVSSAGDIAIAGMADSPVALNGAPPWTGSGTYRTGYVARWTASGTLIGGRAFPEEVEPTAIGVRNDGTLAFAAVLYKPFDFGLGSVAPPSGLAGTNRENIYDIAPVFVTFDKAMTLVGATAFWSDGAPASSDEVCIGFGGGVYGIYEVQGDLKLLGLGSFPSSVPSHFLSRAWGMSVLR